MSDFILQQTDAEVQAILNRIQPLIDTNDIAVFGFGYGTCAVGAAILAYDYLNTKRGLLTKYTLYGCGDISLVVVGGHHHR